MGKPDDVKKIQVRESIASFQFMQIVQSIQERGKSC
jgi:hypothetical protein